MDTSLNLPDQAHGIVQRATLDSIDRAIGLGFCANRLEATESCSVFPRVASAADEPQNCFVQ
jgi:hypothetical protein